MKLSQRDFNTDYLFALDRVYYAYDRHITADKQITDVAGTNDGFHNKTDR